MVSTCLQTLYGINILEHIEPEKLEGVLLELSKITLNLGVLIHMEPRAKILSDERNAHLIQKPSS
jgi:hypothetical protein